MFAVNSLYVLQLKFHLDCLPRLTLSILFTQAIKFYYFWKQLVFMESFKLIIICIKL